MTESFVDLSLGKIPRPVRFEDEGRLYRLTSPGTITLDQMYQALALQDAHPSLFGGFQRIVDKAKMTPEERAVLRAEMIDVMQFAYDITATEVQEFGDLLLIRGVIYFLGNFDFSLILSTDASTFATGKVVPMTSLSNGAQPSRNSSRPTPPRRRKTG